MVRNVFGGLASLFLMLAKIILCLFLLAVDRLVQVGSRRLDVVPAGEPQPVAALEA